MQRIALLLVGSALSIGCGGSTSQGATLGLRAACSPALYWDGTTCQPRGDGAANIATGKDALVKQDVERAKAALDAAAERGGPLDHESNITLWEQRGIAAAFLEDEQGAAAAFDMLLSLDPGHILSYRLGPQVTFVFEKVRNELKTQRAPAVDVNWPSGQKVGDPVPLEIDVIADPKKFLRRATVFVRTRGDLAVGGGWRAADLTLAQGDTRIVLPGIRAQQSTSLELYLRAYDDRGNEVLAWADPTRPREIPLRYDPPVKWYRNWKTFAIGGPAIALVTGLVVYALTIAPPDNVSGSAVVK